MNSIEFNSYGGTSGPSTNGHSSEVEPRTYRLTAATLQNVRARPTTMKPNLANLIAEKAAWFLKLSGGKSLFSAKLVCELLVRDGFYPRVQRWDTFGDKLGGHGLKLPAVFFDRARRYDISYIGKTAEEKAIRTEQLRRMTSGQRRALKAEIH